MNTETLQDNAILSVSELNRAVSQTLSRTFPLVTVRGEISNFTRAASGHWYFTLKDAGAQVRAVMFKGRAQYVDWVPREGDRVEVRATIGLYEARGDFQLGVEAMRRAGVGDLYAEFLRIKDKLAAEGLFASERKLPLPRFPRRIGVVTSLQAAALRDVLTTLQRRAPHVSVVLYPVLVQGAGAAEKMTNMLSIANQRAEVDVLLLVRGGGSIEDLWAFNDESLARAIATSTIPIISGVGHETDFTIADFAGSVRAATPTAAASLAVPDRQTLIEQTQGLWQRGQRATERRLQNDAQRLDRWQRDLLSAHGWLERWRWVWQTMQQRFVQAVLHEQRLRQQRLQGFAQALHLLNPQQVLERGYSIVLNDAGQVVSSATQTAVGANLEVQFAQGRVNTTVTQVSLPVAQ